MEYQIKSPQIQAVFCQNPYAENIQDCFNEFPKWLEDSVRLGIVTRVDDRRTGLSKLRIKRPDLCTIELREDEWLICTFDETSIYPQFYWCKSETFYSLYKKVNNEK